MECSVNHGDRRTVNRAYSRRTFLKSAALAGAAAFSIQDALGNILAAESRADPPAWVDKPMRWAQLTLVEDDPGKFDPKFWRDYFKRTRSDAVWLGAGGW